MVIQTHVHVITPKRVAKATTRRPGFAARIRHANSRIPMALPKEWRPRYTTKTQTIADMPGMSENQRIAES